MKIDKLKKVSGLFTLLLLFSVFTLSAQEESYVEAENLDRGYRVILRDGDTHKVAQGETWVYRIKELEIPFKINQDLDQHIETYISINSSEPITKGRNDKPIDSPYVLNTSYTTNTTNNRDTEYYDTKIQITWNELSDANTFKELFIEYSAVLVQNYEDGGYHDEDSFEGSVVFEINVVEDFYTWYPDSDGDGFGDPETELVITETPEPPFPGAVHNNDDKCPNEKSSINNGCFEDLNFQLSRSFDVNGDLKSASMQYFDDSGKSTQTQTLDVSTGRTWATQTLYDSQGQEAVQTFSAPVRDIAAFQYKTYFFTNKSNSPYSTRDFEINPEAPTKSGKQANSLGYYYSTQNTTQANQEDDHRLIGDTYQDITDYPFVRTIYSKLNPGRPLKVIGGNKQDGEWKQSYTFSMAAGDALSREGAFNNASYTTSNGSMKLIKTISRDVHGTETVVFTDTDGRTLATARTGAATARETKVAISNQGYVDVHVPVGTTGFRLQNTTGRTIEVYNLITETVTSTPTTSLTHGFYRVSITNLATYNANNPVIVNCKENYYDYSLNKYDETGRLIKSYQPLNKLESSFDYDALGQLTHTKSPDEGESWFKYRKDGQIRFSQNTKQRDPNRDGNTNDQEFSYTNYDSIARPIESGVAVGNFNNLNPNALSFKSSSKREQQFTVYDSQNLPTGTTAPSKTFAQAVHSLGLTAAQQDSYTPHFLAGNVAVTYTKAPETTITWYSYDIYGRVEWIIQHINGLGTKTIDYQYNPITGLVTQVDFQKNTANERFSHRYTYDPTDDTLVKVETSTNGSSFTTEANYKYNETGNLKRVELAPQNNTGSPLQGVDYAYTLSGQLKAINPPGLNKTGDPDDLFSMVIDYNNDDYKRHTSLKAPNYGNNQFNGNIKGVRWNNKPLDNAQQTYSYYYNKENWLTDAVYGQYANTADTAIEQVEDNNVYIGVNKTISANTSIVLKDGFHAKPSGNQLVTISIAPAAGTAFKTGDYNVYGITYDANGNIQTLNRNKNTVNGQNKMDQLSYQYKLNKPNQLIQVTDAADPVEDAEDIETQQANNYEYNAIGQLIANHTENISYIYNTSGLVSEIKKDDQTQLKFFYNDKGHRVRKEAYVNNVLSSTQHYVRDAAGTALAIYNNGSPVEHTIYGANRLGVYKPNANRTGGSRVYQLTDHLGNVRAVVQRAANNQPVAVVSTDYYPFGMPMPNRKIVNGEPYRYAYQGQEKDPETGKEAFQLRLWDARIGRWLTTDPYGQFDSPYLGMGNNPISMIDPDGGYCPDCPDDGTKGIGNAGDTFDSSNGYTYSMGDDGVWWSDAEFADSGTTITGSATPSIFRHIMNYSFPTIKDPWPEHKWKWFKNRSSGDFVWGDAHNGNEGRKRGKDGVIYNSYTGNDLTPGGGGGRAKSRLGTIITSFNDGMSAGGHVESVIEPIVKPMITPVDNDTITFILQAWKDGVHSGGVGGEFTGKRSANKAIKENINVFDWDSIQKVKLHD